MNDRYLPVRIGASPLTFRFFVTCLVLVFCSGAWCIYFTFQNWSSTNSWIGATLVFGVLICPVSAYLLYIVSRGAGTTSLVVTSHAAKIGKLEIPWSHIRSAEVGSVKIDGPKGCVYQVYLCLSLHDPDQFWLAHTEYRARFARVSQTCGGLGLPSADFYINLQSASQLPDEALNIVNERISPA